MGTNFYAVMVPTPQEYQKMEQLLKEKNLKALQEAISKYTVEYHIGKRSCGWQFLFQCKGPGVFVPWDTILESIKEFLARPYIQIKDEYGTIYTSEQFWDEIKDCMYTDNEHKNLKQYYRDEHMMYYEHEHNEFTSYEGLRFCNVEFS